MSKHAAGDEFAELCAALPGLTPAQLDALRLRVAFLRGEDAPPTAPGGPRADGADWLARGIEDELRRRGLLGSGRLPATKLRSDWAEVSKRLRADLLAALGEAGERKTSALGRLAARALADWLAAGRVPVSPRTMVGNAEKVFAALDAAFPGYVGAGLLRCCLDPKLVGAD